MIRAGRGGQKKKPPALCGGSSGACFKVPGGSGFPGFNGKGFKLVTCPGSFRIYFNAARLDSVHPEGGRAGGGYLPPAFTSLLSLDIFLEALFL